MLSLSLLDHTQEESLILEFRRVGDRYQQELDKIIAQQKDEPLEYIEFIKAKVEAFKIDAPRIIKALNGTLIELNKDKLK